MNEDGVLDLVIGARSGQQILIHMGNGDTTFTHLETQASGGNTWMLTTGDVDGDGHEDIAAVNSSANNGAILLGDGNGQLAPPQLYATDPFGLATDLGDIDGDGDLDWVTSSFSGDWFLFTNNGSGTFSFAQEFDAPLAASCALLLDIDNDRDLDLALIDELKDEVIILSNGLFNPCGIYGDLTGSVGVDLDDILCVLDGFADPDACPAADIAPCGGDDKIDLNDILAILEAFAGNGACDPCLE